MIAGKLLKVAVVLGIVTIAGIGAGCRGKGIKPSPLPDFEPSQRVQVLWNTSAGVAKGYIFSPAYTENKVCAAGYTGRLTCFDSRTGRRLWSSSSGVPLSGGVGVVDNMILVGSEDGELLAFDKDGILLWREQLSSEILSAPAGAGSTVIVRTGDSRFYGLDSRDGRQLWQYQAPEQPLTLRSNPGFAIVEGSAVIGGVPGGRMSKVDIRDGGLLWTIAVATPRGDNELERIADIAGTPVVKDERVCAVTYQGRIGCFDAEKGTQIWARDASSAGGLTVDSRNVYYTEADGVVVALDWATGASVWRQEKLLHRRVSSPLVIGDWVAVGDYQGYTHLMSRDDGSFAARVPTDGSNIVATPISMDGKLLLLTQAGGLFAFSIDG